MPALKASLVMIHNDHPALREHLDLVDGHALARAALRQSQSLGWDTIVRVEENELAIPQFLFDPLDPSLPLMRPARKGLYVAWN
jgi:hypothetical protein